MISWYPVMDVLNTISPTSTFSSPKPSPWNILPSSKTKIELKGIIISPQIGKIELNIRNILKKKFWNLMS